VREAIERRIDFLEMKMENTTNRNEIERR